MEDQKKRQLEYHEEEHYCSWKPRYADNSNPLVAWINSYRLRITMETIGVPLAGKSILCVCGGDGEEADYLQKSGADVTLIDLSPAGIAAAKIRNPAVKSLCMDAEHLAFPDRSFDWAIVREGLHHLARPLKGLYEMERVSREGFVILEGQDSIIVRLLARIGLADNWDPSGGYVYRFGRREIHKVLTGVQTIDRWTIHAAWMPYGSDILKYFPFFTRFIYPLINYPAFLRILSSKLARKALKRLFRCVNWLLGRWGNCLIVIAWKKPIERGAI
jgi:ubiquinone/menaquinone biosynthesis C-methylase UbiE